MIRLWLGVVAVGIVLLMAISMSFLGKVRTRLSLRIAMLILLAGPLFLLAFALLNTLFYGSLHEPAPWWSRLIQMILIIFGGPLFLGLLASRYITQPLSQFNKAIMSLKENDYQVAIDQTGIREFDEVSAEFNDLIARLQKEEELRKNLISDTSHELYTPLTAMVSHLTAMEEGVLPITKQRVKLVAQQAERLADLIARLNEYTKARALSGLGAPEDVLVEPLIYEVMQTFAAQLSERHVAISLKLPRAYTLVAHRESLERICINLVQNVLRYAGAHTITVSGTNRELRFSDDGSGVPVDSLAHLFERFYRVDPSRNRDTGGLGLGLSIVRELAERQGWHVRAEDNHPGLAIIFKIKA